MVIEAAAVGSYHTPNHGSGDYYYEAGHGSFGEARNYFIFSVPTLSEPLVGAELRVHSSWVTPTNGSVLFQLHQVEAEPVYLIIHDSSDYVMIFNDLGEGPVLGSGVISGSEGRRNLYGDPGALLRIPLNTDGLNEIRARQGNWCAFGGAVPATPAPALVFINGTPGLYQPQLVLYFSNAGPPEVTYVDPTPIGTVLATDRVMLAATVCGKTPMTRQWFKDGTRIPDATNETLEIRSMSAADAGTYQLVAANEAGIGAGPLHELQFSPVHIFVETNRYFYEGNDATLYAAFVSRLPLTYQWRKHGTNLFGGTEGFLRLPDIRPEDAGEYEVVASNSSGSRTSEVINVTVLLRPPFFYDREPHTNTVGVGVSLDLYNFAQGSPPLQYQWYKDGEAVPGATSNLFRLSSVGFNDAGVYRLVAANAAGSATTDVYHVTVEPIVVGPLYSLSVPWLNPLNYQAYIESSVPWTAQWYFNDAPLPDQTNQMLRIAAFDYVNEGDYFLIASNIYGISTSTVATFTVVTNPPTVWIGMAYSEVWVGDDAEFSGYASGGPPPTLQWLFNGEPFGAPIPNAFTARLELRNVTTNHSGTYALMASNVFGVAISESRILTVTAEAPFFINVPAETNELVGNIVILRAKAIAGPPPTYQWRKDGVDLLGQTNASLNVGAVQFSDAGVYEIVARNELGEARHSHVLRVLRPTGLDRWSWRLPKPQGSRLYQLTHSDGRYVATGKAGNTITSTDGFNWTGAVIEADTDLNVLAGGNGVFVAAGMYRRPLLRTNEHKLPSSDNRYIFDHSGLLVLSSNGVNWSVGNSPVEDQIFQIAFGNGIFVASGYNSPGFCFTSLDGRNWASQGYSDRKAYRIIFGNGRFMVQGSDGRLYVSTDGINWTVTTPQQTAQLEAFANGRFLAFLDYSGTLSESTDGVNWTVLGTRSLLYPWNGIAGGGGVYVGSGYVPAGQVLYSSDAVNWTPVDTGTRQEIESVIYANGQFLGVGEAGMITRSANGLTWTPDEVANKIDFYGITHGEGLHVAAGDAGTILASSNAVDWARANTPTTRNLHAVTYANGLFVAGGRAGTLITSPDGVNWTARVSGMTNYIERIAWAEGRWVAVAEGGGITTSTDGANWSAINTGAPFTDHEGVAHGNGVWVVVGGYFNNPQNDSQAVSTLYSSANGLDWTRRGPNAGKRWRDVTFGRGMFVAVGNDGMISSSTNGIDWAAVSFVPYQNLRRVHYANGRFVAVGNDGTLISSPTGASWTKHRSRNSQNLHDIHAGPDGKFIFVGNNGMLLQSGDTRPRFLSINRSGRIEFDSGIAASLRLERSPDLQTWETEAVNVTSPVDAPVGGGQKFWRLAE